MHSSCRTLPFIVLGLSCTMPACTPGRAQEDALRITEAAVEYLRVQYIAREPGPEAARPSRMMIISGELIGRRASALRLNATGAHRFAHVLADRLGTRAGRYSSILAPECKWEVLHGEEGADCSFTDGVSVALSPSLPEVEGKRARIFVRWYYTFDSPSGEGELAAQKIRLELERTAEGSWRVVDVPYYGG